MRQRNARSLGTFPPSQWDGTGQASVKDLTNT
jgi:hypothetical protein